MMNMLVKLDIPYNSNDEIWKELDGIFAEQGCGKINQPNGTILYTGNRNSNNNFTEFGVLYVILSDNDRFMKHIKEWILFDNEDDESLPFQEIDMLKEMEEFRKAYGE